MLTETGYFWLGVWLCGMGGSSFASSFRSLRSYKSAPKPEEATAQAGIWFILGLIFAVGAFLVWRQTAATVYLDWLR